MAGCPNVRKKFRFFRGPTVPLRSKLTENAFRTRPERVWNDFQIAFQLRSKCVPLRSKSRFTGVRHLAERVPNALPLHYSAIVVNYRVNLNTRKEIDVKFTCVYTSNMGKLSEYARERMI